MRKFDPGVKFSRRPSILVAASSLLLLFSTPARAGGDITNFNVKNCSDERIFVCSFDKTDSLMNVPYIARGIQPGERKEFGCASLNKCKVIIGVSKRKAKRTLSTGMQAALGAGSVVAAGVAGGAAYGAASTSAALSSTVFVFGTNVATPAIFTSGAAATVSTLTTVAIGAAVLSAVVGGAVAGIEIADGWSDGEVCNQVRKAAQKAGLKPKHFLKNGKKYQVVEQYAVGSNNKPYLYPDGTAVIAYATQKAGGSCPAALNKQIISD